EDENAYWQQEVNYSIQVTLNDSLHELNAYLEIEYINNSPDTLKYIWFHLWPNAYKDHSTAFAKQLLDNGQTDFYFSKSSQRGYIDKLEFKVDDINVNWEIDPDNIDICKIILIDPIKPGGEIVITTPFHVKIPETFSRLGHEGQSYQISQWYPKPAVYDHKGWHPIPYLDQGEFYSEFGSFDVKLTLPDNYVVGATGDLQTASEIEWLNEKAEQTASTIIFSNIQTHPPSSRTTKTLHYKQDNIHDFAWFADKRYHVLKDEVVFKRSKKKVTTWAMFTNQNPQLWKGSMEHIKGAIKFYSKEVGEYPYNQVTVVQGALSASGGMEYPTITVISGIKDNPSLERVIVHEVGHNWFYGILGSNERLHPWMDEGINSYYEARYTKEKHFTRTFLGKIDSGSLGKFLDFKDYPLRTETELFYLFIAISPAVSYKLLNQFSFLPKVY
ncbi:MAG: M1 family metallopeptidase, partial [Bacteroidetes bacterium]|nr:M1 family metallopeptidase [Bacteroidota bacterium]